MSTQLSSEDVPKNCRHNVVKVTPSILDIGINNITCVSCETDITEPIRVLTGSYKHDEKSGYWLRTPRERTRVL